MATCTAGAVSRTKRASNGSIRALVFPGRPEKDIKKKQVFPLLIGGLGPSSKKAPVVDVACGSSVNLARCADGASTHGQRGVRGAR